jgi:hypothetical protein
MPFKGQSEPFVTVRMFIAMTMIQEALTYTVGQLNTFLGAISDAAVLGNISYAQDNDAEANAMTNKVVLSLINIEQDRMSQDPWPYKYQGTTLYKQNPAVNLNLYLLFSANFETYSDGLAAIDKVVEFFQNTGYFTTETNPDLPVGLNRLIFDMFSVDLDLVHHLWSMLGSKYMPSVVYKMRMVSIQYVPDQLTAAPLIQHVTTVSNIQ